MYEEDGCHKLEDTCTQERRLVDGRGGGQGATGTVEPWSSSSSSSSIASHPNEDVDWIQLAQDRDKSCEFDNGDWGSMKSWECFCRLRNCPIFKKGL